MIAERSRLLVTVFRASVVLLLFVVFAPAAVQAKVTLGSGFKTCIYFKGDSLKKENVQECKAAVIENGQSVCDDPPDATFKVQGSPKLMAETDMCVLNQQCCLIYIDDDEDGKWDKGEAKACHPANVGCNTLFYTTESNDAKPPKEKVQAVVVKNTCAKEYSCESKIFTVESAQQKFTANAQIVANLKAKEVTQAEAEEAQAASAAAGGAVWTKALCEKAGNIWSAPVGGPDAGNFCYAKTKDANLQVPILGFNAATLTSYIPLVFRYSLGLLALITVLSLIYAGFLWSANGGNPEAVQTAKSVITGSFAGLALALGGFTLLKTINPALIELKPPSIQAVLPLEVVEVSASNICCKGVSCLQMEVKGRDQTQILAAGFAIPVSFGGDADPAAKVSVCPLMKAEGEYCKTNGPFNDACVKAGGTCVVDSGNSAKASDMFQDLKAGADASQQGWCSSFYYNFWVPGVVGSVAGALDLAFKPAGWLLEIGSSFAISEGAEKVKDFLTNPDPDQLIPGTGPIGRCVKMIDKRVSGQYCNRNEQCASGVCVRLEGTASCFVDKEIGICSDGKARDICHPLNHTLVGGWNTFTVKPICKSGLFCKYVKTTASATWNPGKIPGQHFECSDGKLGSACGLYSADCGGQSSSSLSCDGQPTMLGKAMCNYESQKDYVTTRLKTHAAVAGADKVATIVDLIASGGQGKIAKAIEAISLGLGIAAEVSDKQLQTDLAKLKNYAYQIEYTDPNAKNCPIDVGGKDTGICGNEFSCQQMGTVSNEEYRCNVTDGGKTEGSICTYHGSHVQKYFGSNATTSGDTCNETLGLKCSVARHPDYADQTDNYGFCTKATWGSPCVVSGQTIGKTIEGPPITYSIEPRDCDKLESPTGNAGFPVCYKQGSDSFGKCGWMEKYDEELNGYPLGGSGQLYMSDSKTGSVYTEYYPKSFGETCTKFDQTTALEVNEECNGALQGPWVWLNNMTAPSELKKDPAFLWVVSTYPALKQKYPNLVSDYSNPKTKDKNTAFVPYCFSKKKEDLLGKCGVVFQYRQDPSITDINKYSTEVLSPW